jgi:lipopolysaccharide transport system ATP-binding protein
VEKFVDTPLKRYSSGMRLRLGFAVAAHLDPDILLVDEVLAVGDAEFQKKCLKTMGELQTSGRTVLFVSHNMAAIESLCHRVIWIDQGNIHRDGDRRTVIREYLATFSDSTEGKADLSKITSRSGTGDARLTGIDFLDKKRQTKNIICSGDDLLVSLNFEVKETIADLHVGLELYNEMGAMITAINNWMTGPAIPRIKPGKYTMDLDIDMLNLMPGTYHVSLWLKSAGRRDFDVLDYCVKLEVVTTDYYGSGRGIDSRFGQIFLPGRWMGYKALSG